jgi:phosphatidate cytidylyltransferase
MLRWRLLGAFAILAPLLILIWLDDQCNGGHPGIWLGPLTVLIGILAAHELNQLLGKAGLPTSSTANICGVFCVLSATLVPLAWSPSPTDVPSDGIAGTLIGLTIALGCLFAAELIRFRVPGESLARLAGGSLVIVYAGVLLSFLLQLRMLPPGRVGLMAVIATILIVKLADTGAFFVGRSIGRIHFTSISPKKTVEGVCGGVVAAMLAAWLVRDVLFPVFAPATPRGHVVFYLIYGAVLAGAGLVGDLSESLLKRDVQQKDSSQWLRGLGGVLDVIDSLLVAAPVSFVCWASGWLA